MSNPKFLVTLEMETIKEPFGKNVDALTNMDMAMELSRLLIKGRDVKKIKILKFEKMEVEK